MKKQSVGKQVLYLFLAFAAAFVLQFVAAFAVMIPGVAVKSIQLAAMGESVSASEVEQLLNEFIMSLTGPTVLVTHIVLLVCFALWYGFGCCRRGSLVSSFKYTFTGRNIGVILLIAVGGCYFTNFAMPIASLIIPENIMQAYMDLMETAGFGESVVTTVAAVLIAPFGEELIFRGVVYHYACGFTSGMPDRKKAFYIANTIQALGFGIFHGNIVQGTYAFLLGLLLGYLRERFGSVWASILAHMVLNGISSFLWEPIAMLLPESIPVYAVGALISMAVLIAGMKLGGPALQKNDN